VLAVVDGLALDAELDELALDAELEVELLLEPHAATTRPTTAASATAWMNLGFMDASSFWLQPVAYSTRTGFPGQALQPGSRLSMRVNQP
jgi:hypothetical protein